MIGGKSDRLLVLGILMAGAGLGDPAQLSADDDAAGKDTAVITLGTAGGPRPRADRSQSANLLTVNGAFYLVDAGENTVRRLTQAGVNFNGVHHLFITHAHSDHTMGLPALVATQWEFQQRTALQIFGPPGTSNLVEGMMAFLGANEKIRFAEGNPSPLSRIVDEHDVQPGPIFQDANVAVTAVENTHFHFPENSPAHGRFKAYSYRIDTAHGSVVFTGDTGPSDALVELAKGADMLVTEVSDANQLIALYKKNGQWQRKTAEEQKNWLRHQIDEHLSPGEVGTLAARAGVKMVILTHLTPVEDEMRSYHSIACEVKSHFDGKVVVASDLGHYRLDGTADSFADGSGCAGG